MANLRKVKVQGDSITSVLNQAKKKYGDEVQILESKRVKNNEVMVYEATILIDDDTAIDMPTPSIKGNNPYSQNNNLMPKSQNDDIVSSLKSDMKEITKLLEESNPSSMGLTKDNNKLNLIKNASITKQEKKIQTKVQTKVQAKVQDEVQNETQNEISEKVSTEQITPKDKEQNSPILDDRLKKLGVQMDIIKNILWDRDGYHKDSFKVPPEFSEVYNTLKFSNMNKQHIDLVMMQSNEGMPTKMKLHTEAIKKYFKTLIKNLIHVKAEESVNAKKKIQMLVGPTGVGKTTTLAKLAARYSYDFTQGYAIRKKTVGIITLDNFKLGAIEQLRLYAKHMELDIKVVINPMEFIKALKELSSCDYIFIDTAGSSQYDKQKIMSLKEYLMEDEDFDINVSLVMPVNLSENVFEDVFNGFDMLDIDDIILTKLDETKYYGPIFSFLFDIKRPLTYFSYGQNVPDDIMVADKNFIVEKLFNSLSKS